MLPCFWRNPEYMYGSLSEAKRGVAIFHALQRGLVLARPQGDTAQDSPRSLRSRSTTPRFAPRAKQPAGLFPPLGFESLRAYLSQEVVIDWDTCCNKKAGAP